MPLFCTAGPCQPGVHVMVPPEERLPTLGQSVQEKHYRLLRAPWRSGKTTLLNVCAERLRHEGTAALRVSLASSAGLEPQAAQQAWVQTLLEAAEQLPPEWRPTTDHDASDLRAFLARWSGQLRPTRLVLFLDDADQVTGHARMLLVQILQHGYPERIYGYFPTAVVLAGTELLPGEIVHSFDRGRALTDYQPMVRTIVHRTRKRLPDLPDDLDLMAIGYMGLLHAVDRYSPDRGGSFRAFAELHIQAAILEHLQERGFIPATRPQPTRRSDAAPLTLHNFTRAEVDRMLSGVAGFTPERITALYRRTGGQPWLVNVLAEAVYQAGPTADVGAVAEALARRGELETTARACT